MSETEDVLVPCDACARHVRHTESRCPFCERALPAREIRVIVVPRLSRAGQLALWAALAACSRQSQVSAGAASASDSTPTADARTIEPTSTLADAAQVASDAADNDAAQAFAELRPRASRADAGARSSRDPAAAAARQALLAMLSQAGPGDIRTIVAPGMNNVPPLGAAAYGAPPIAIPDRGLSDGDGVTTGRSVRGSLSISQVRDNTGTLEAALRRQMGPLRSCFERELRNNPTLAGVATLTMTINPAGQPEGVAIASAVAPEPMIACLTRRIVAMVSAVLRFTPVS